MTILPYQTAREVLQDTTQDTHIIFEPIGGKAESFKIYYCFDYLTVKMKPSCKLVWLAKYSSFYTVMDCKELSEILECSVCLERLDHTSKVLPCQHTFCKRCLEEIQSMRKELRCPECRILVEDEIDNLPSNIILVRILEGLNRRNPNSSERTSITKQVKHIISI